ncbi:MAG: branched-chain amino acid ABC transporter permease [Brevefilum sp.]
MNKEIIRSSSRKGLLFGIVMIFLVLINFHLMASTMISKLLGTNVLRGSLPEARFFVIFLVLYSIWVGWSAASREGKTTHKLFEGLFAGLTAGLTVALFGLLIFYMLETQTNIRKYLTALSFPSMRFFLLELGGLGILVHFGLFTVLGLAGSALAVGLRSQKVTQFKQSIKAAITKLRLQITNALPESVNKYGKYGIYLLLLVILFLLPTRWGSYYNFVFGMVGLYVILGIGLNIMLGLSGQFMIGIAALFAMGAYSVALLNSPIPHGLMWGFWPSLAVGVVMAVIGGLLLGLPIMRLRGDYLGIVTLGFGEIIRILLNSDLLTDITGGPRGVQNIQQPTFLGTPFNDVMYAYLIIVAMAVSIFLYYRLENSRTGRAWLSIKEDALVAQATGIDVQKYKLLALCVGAAFAGLAGGIFAARNQFTGPNDHTLMVSINVLSVVIVGGLNSIPGIILGSFALRGLPELLRELETYRLLVFGALLVFMMLVRPDGLWPASRPDLEEKGSPGLKEDIEPAEEGRSND